MTDKKEYDYLKIGFYCGLIPLASGLFIYVLFRLRLPFTQLLPVIGLFVMWIGVFLVLTGLGSLIVYLLGTGQTRGRGLSQRLIRALLVAVLLLVNFPAAYFCVMSVFEVMTRYTLRITNDSGQKIDNLVVTGPGLVQPIGPLADGAYTKQYFHFNGDGSITLKVVVADTESILEIESYTTSGMGGDKTIRIEPNLVVDVSRTYQ